MAGVQATPGTFACHCKYRSFKASHGPKSHFVKLNFRVHTNTSVSVYKQTWLRRVQVGCSLLRLAFMTSKPLLSLFKPHKPFKLSLGRVFQLSTL